MKTIWKFQLAPADEQRLRLPLYRFLHVEVQGRQPCLWAIVDPDAPEREVRVFTRGTGHPLGPAETAQYVGSYQLDEGAFVGHVFVL